MPNQQEEPDTAGQVQQQWNRISRVSQQVDHGEEDAVHFALDPAVLDSWIVQRSMRRGVVSARSASDEGCGESPGKSDEDEAEDVVEDRGLVLGHGGCGLLDSPEDRRVTS